MSSSYGNVNGGSNGSCNSSKNSISPPKRDAKNSVLVATTGNIALNGLQVIDGVQLKKCDEVLVWNQTDKTQNGIYVAKSGNWRRRKDLSKSGFITMGVRTWVVLGDTYAKSLFILVNDDPVVLGVSDLCFEQIALGGGNNTDDFVINAEITGSELVLTRLSGGTVSVDLAGFLDDTDNFVSGGTYNNGNIDFTGTNSNTTFSVNVSALLDDTNDYVDGASLVGNVLTLTRTGSLADLTVDLTQFLDNTDNYVDSAALVGNILTLGRTGALADLTVDLSEYLDDTDSYIESITCDDETGVLTFVYSDDKADLTLDLGKFFDDTYIEVVNFNEETGLVTFSYSDDKADLTLDLSTFFSDKGRFDYGTGADSAVMCLTGETQSQSTGIASYAEGIDNLSQSKASHAEGCGVVAGGSGFTTVDTTISATTVGNLLTGTLEVCDNIPFESENYNAFAPFAPSYFESIFEVIHGTFVEEYCFNGVPADQVEVGGFETEYITPINYFLAIDPNFFDGTTPGDSSQECVDRIQRNTPVEGAFYCFKVAGGDYRSDFTLIDEEFYYNPEGANRYNLMADAMITDFSIDSWAPCEGEGYAWLIPFAADYDPVANCTILTAWLITNNEKINCLAGEGLFLPEYFGLEGPLAAQFGSEVTEIILVEEEVEIAPGDYAHASGTRTEANAFGSYAEGCDTYAGFSPEEVVPFTTIVASGITKNFTSTIVDCVPSNEMSTSVLQLFLASENAGTEALPFGSGQIITLGEIECQDELPNLTGGSVTVDSITITYRNNVLGYAIVASGNNSLIDDICECVTATEEILAETKFKLEKTKPLDCTKFFWAKLPDDGLAIGSKVRVDLKCEEAPILNGSAIDIQIGSNIGSEFDENSYYALIEFDPINSGDINNPIYEPEICDLVFSNNGIQGIERADKFPVVNSFSSCTDSYFTDIISSEPALPVYATGQVIATETPFITVAGCEEVVEGGYGSGTAYDYSFGKINIPSLDLFSNSFKSEFETLQTEYSAITVLIQTKEARVEELIVSATTIKEVLIPAKEIECKDLVQAIDDAKDALKSCEIATPGNCAAEQATLTAAEQAESDCQAELKALFTLLDEVNGEIKQCNEEIDILNAELQTTEKGIVEIVEIATVESGILDCIKVWSDGFNVESLDFILECDGSPVLDSEGNEVTSIKFNDSFFIDAIFQEDGSVIPVIFTSWELNLAVGSDFCSEDPSGCSVSTEIKYYIEKEICLLVDQPLTPTDAPIELLVNEGVKVVSDVNIASSDASYAHAEGANTFAYGKASHAEGCFTQAGGRFIVEKETISSASTEVLLAGDGFQYGPRILEFAGTNRPALNAFFNQDISAFENSSIINLCQIDCDETDMRSKAGFVGQQFYNVIVNAQDSLVGCIKELNSVKDEFQNVIIKINGTEIALGEVCNNIDIKEIALENLYAQKDVLENLIFSGNTALSQNKFNQEVFETCLRDNNDDFSACAAQFAALTGYQETVIAELSLDCDVDTENTVGEFAKCLETWIEEKKNELSSVESQIITCEVEISILVSEKNSLTDNLASLNEDKEKLQTQIDELEITCASYECGEFNWSSEQDAIDWVNSQIDAGAFYPSMYLQDNGPGSENKPSGFNAYSISLTGVSETSPEVILLNSVNGNEFTGVFRDKNFINPDFANNIQLLCSIKIENCPALFSNVGYSQANNDGSGIISLNDFPVSIGVCIPALVDVEIDVTKRVGDGDYAHVGGVGVEDAKVKAFGRAAFNHSETNESYKGNGAVAPNSAILGGINNEIKNSAERSVILGCQDIIADKPDTVYACNIDFKGELLQNGEPLELGGPWESGSGPTSAQLRGGRNKSDGQLSVAEGFEANALRFASHAEGQQTTAGGDVSHAEGDNTKALGGRSHSEGFRTTANGGASHSEGVRTTAEGYASHAEGKETTASGTDSHAEGNQTKSIGVRSHAEGLQTRATGVNSHAEGNNTTASNTNAHAEGQLTTASGRVSHAEGNITISSGNYSHAEGYKTTAKGGVSHSEGSRTTAEGYASHTEGIFTAAIGNASHAEGFLTKSEGESSHAEGRVTLASGENSHAEGNSTTASGLSSHAEGNQSHAEGINSHAEGLGTKSTADSSHAEGVLTVASAQGSHAEGVRTTASGGVSHAEGDRSIAIGKASHAEGISTVASGDNSHAEGISTVASGDNSHAEGRSTTASGLDGHAEGAGSVAAGQTSHAEGSNTQANGEMSHSQGRWTIADGDNSHVGGGIRALNFNFTADTTSRIIASGNTAFVHFEKTIADETTMGAYANNSAILGGVDHNLEVTAERSAIIGGNAIVATVADTVYVPSLVIANIPVAADETAAIGLGLETGTVYRTTTGELRIKL